MDFLLVMDANEWISYMNVEMIHSEHESISCLLVHMHQKTKIALEMAEKIASVIGPLDNMALYISVIALQVAAAKIASRIMHGIISQSCSCHFFSLHV